MVTFLDQVATLLHRYHEEAVPELTLAADLGFWKSFAQFARWHQRIDAICSADPGDLCDTSQAWKPQEHKPTRSMQ